jgi:putative DNA primase/helicase
MVKIDATEQPVKRDSAGDYHQSRLDDGAECLAAALDLQARGLSVLAICPPDHVGVGKGHGKHCESPGKAPWGPWKDCQEREKRATADELRRKWNALPTCNVGAALGPASELVRFDVEGTAAQAELERLSAGDLPPTWEFKSGRADGTGRGILYRIPPNVEFQTTPKTFQDGELRFQAKGAQTVLPPSRHKDGGRYAWLPGRAPWEIPAALAPQWVINRYQLKPREAKPHNPSDHPDAARVADALRFVGSVEKYDQWLRVGMALHDWDSQAGYELWCEWSKGAPEEYDPEVCEIKWDSFTVNRNGKRVTIATVFKLARDAGWKPAESKVVIGGSGSEAVQPNEAIDDPHRLARLYICERCEHADDGLTLRFYRDEWNRWDGCAYRIVPEKELRAELTQSAKIEMDRLNVIDLKKWQQCPMDEMGNPKPKPVVRKITGRMIADNAHALASLTVLSSRVEAPAWIDDGPPAAEMLACSNGLVHLPAFIRGEHRIIAPTPRFFSQNCLAFPFNAKAPRPIEWIGFLNILWPNDVQSINTLQEWIGYLLTPDTRQQKILMLVGPKRSGKGTIARIIRGLLGADNVAGPTLSSLGTNFGLWPLLGKSAAIISDARLSGRTDTATVTERLLSISGEDALTVDRKNLSPVTVKLPTRFSILTNELPRLGDSSGALTGRMILLRMTQSWFGKEDTSLTDRLLTELPGILLWAIDGWKRLQERGRFVQPDEGREMLNELDDLASPIGAFVRERCYVDPGARATVADLFTDWKRWCEVKGRKEPGNEQTFGRDLLAAVPTLKRVRGREGEERYRAYEGIGLDPIGV